MRKKSKRKTTRRRRRAKSRKISCSHMIRSKTINHFTRTCNKISQETLKTTTIKRRSKRSCRIRALRKIKIKIKNKKRKRRMQMSKPTTLNNPRSRYKCNHHSSNSVVKGKCLPTSIPKDL